MNDVAKELEALKSNGSAALDRMREQLLKRLEGDDNDIGRAVGRIRSDLSQSGGVADVSDLSLLARDLAKLQALVSDMQFHAGQSQVFASVLKVGEK